MAWTGARWTRYGLSQAARPLDLGDTSGLMNALLARDADEADRATADYIRGGERTVLKYIRNEESTRRPPVALSAESQQTEPLR